MTHKGRDSPCKLPNISEQTIVRLREKKTRKVRRESHKIINDRVARPVRTPVGVISSCIVCACDDV